MLDTTYDFSTLILALFYSFHHRSDSNLFIVKFFLIHTSLSGGKMLKGKTPDGRGIEISVLWR